MVRNFSSGDVCSLAEHLDIRLSLFVRQRHRNGKKPHPQKVGVELKHSNSLNLYLIYMVTNSCDVLGFCSLQSFWGP